jgi:hypothetical protein
LIWTAWTRKLISIFAEEEMGSKSRSSTIVWKRGFAPLGRGKALSPHKQQVAYCCSTSFNRAALPLSPRR